MEAHTLRLAAYAGGLAATLILACYLTPARWWRRPTLRNLGFVAIGTCCIGALLLQAFGGGAGEALAAAGSPGAAATDGAAGHAPRAAPQALAPFRVHRDLNLRAAPGTSAARLAVVPAGTLVTPTGERDGDWWQIRAEADGGKLTGWASSLWLRRQME